MWSMRREFRVADEENVRIVSGESAISLVVFTGGESIAWYRFLFVECTGGSLVNSDALSPKPEDKE